MEKKTAMTGRPLYFIIFVMLLVVSCGGWRGGGGGRNGMGDFCKEVYTPRYAAGFVISGAEGRQSTVLSSRNPWQGAEGVETRLFIARNGETPPEGFDGEVLRGIPERIVCISSTHIAMLDALGAVEKVVGVSGIDYITNSYVSANRSRIADVGYEGNVDYEALVALDADLVLLFGINGASGMEGKLRELGIPFAYIGDYLEESPLGKAEWLVAVGEIAGCRERAERIYGEIPVRYGELKDLAAACASERPAVMLNTPYGDSWFMAPKTSYVAQLVADAGGSYVYRKNSSTRSLPIDMEEASLLVSQSDVWLNVGDIKSLGELKRRLPKFADSRCVVSGDVWNCDLRMNAAGGNDYWESGVIHPELVLRDLIKIFHPELLPDAGFVYYRRLK